MSSEEPFATESHKTDEQVAIEQERVDEERETSFQFQKEARDVVPETGAPADAEVETAAMATSSEPTLPQNAAETNEKVVAEEVEEEEETAAVEEAALASGSKSSRSSRKSRASGARPDEEDHARKRARKSAVATASNDPDTNANVRLDRLRQALYRFLDLIEHRATRTSFAKALPHIDSESVEALRQQFVNQLKEAIIDESEKLIESNELESKLASLHRLAHEADLRYQAAYQQGAEEIKDVWSKDLDLETAISAKAIPDQERRVNELKLELEQVRIQNSKIHEQLMDTRARCDAIQRDARDSLDALDSAIKGLEATPDMQKQLRQTMDDLLQDLGARV
ncbi:uncharacterized protein UTRI_10587 [Ustilago trichophora]|uniref:Uncharacterized protein n=1 Tax=Ustilago trichophora TaxID=86804 RepID=A0A5C3EBB5_9BASI|nr:uncharacterized protein UTRI_10587 [Ustilago trichophora]